MLFELANAHSTIIRLKNHVLGNFLGTHVVVYVNDILDYIKSLDKHAEHPRIVLSTHLEDKLIASLRTFAFCMDNFVVLDFYVSADYELRKKNDYNKESMSPCGVKMHEEKIITNMKWSSVHYGSDPTITSSIIQSFLHELYVEYFGQRLDINDHHLDHQDLRANLFQEREPDVISGSTKEENVLMKIRKENKEDHDAKGKEWMTRHKTNKLKEGIVVLLNNLIIMPWIDGPFPVLKSNGNNSDRLDLQGKYNISNTFNDSNLVLFIADKADLRTNHFQEGGDDMIMAKDMELEPELEPEDALAIPSGPMTRSRTRKLKETINSLLTHLENRTGERDACQTSLVLIQAI